MPKMKTHSGAKKRFKVSGSGKLIREQANRRHLFEGKPTTRTRRLAANEVVDPANAPAVNRLLGRR
ncbi:50S ribosomal protein L35 [Spongisporangium articulatum]|uniref:Large ribosomal subunit protein bL35 n=1 Tax=Spongisporangium articulatum TaxID=3362603 RepID=A0ABW8ASM7_9ACTN